MNQTYIIATIITLFLLGAYNQSFADEQVCTEAGEHIPVLDTPPASNAFCRRIPSLQSIGFQHQAEQRRNKIENARKELLDRNKITVVTCGTGSPVPSIRARAQSCTAVFVNGKFFLFDAGNAAAQSIEDLSLPTDAITALFVTHFHSDHIADIGEVISRSWILGRQGSLPVYGGPGIQRIVDGFNLVYAADIAYRRAHHGEEIFPLNTEGSHAIEIEVPNRGGVLVYNRNGVRVRAFPVNHAPIEPAYGYRISYAGRHVVISGDTTDTPNFRRMANGADILVSEVMNLGFIEDAECALNRMGDTRNETIFRDIRTYHIGVHELADLAQEAEAEHLVLTHQVPAVDGLPLQRSKYIRPIRRTYNKGKLTVAKDGTRVTINLK